MHTSVSDSMKLKWREVLWCLTLLELNIFHSCDSTTTESKPGRKVSEKSIKVSKEVVEEAGVKHTGVFLLRYVSGWTFLRFLIEMIRSKGEYGEVATSVDNYERLSSFCYKGLQPSLPHFWSSASLKLELDGTDYQVVNHCNLFRGQNFLIQVYIGSNLTAVARLAQESETAWIYTQVTHQMTKLKIV